VTNAADVSIHRATSGDIDGVVASMAGLFAEDGAKRDGLRNAGWPAEHGAKDLSVAVGDPDRLVLVAKSDGWVVGHLLGSFRPASDMWLAPLAILISMYVRPVARDQGVGSQFVENFVSWAQQRGAKQLRVTAYTANESAIRFYRRHGFALLESTFAVDV
jgi:GNAT superfamily N-acetyltransferase